MGTGDTEPDQHSPVQTVASGLAAISAGYDHTLFVKTDGSLWGMGENDYGQLGTGDYTDQHSPLQIAGLRRGPRSRGAVTIPFS